MSIIIPANSAASGGYAVDNSCRFNVGSSDRLTRTFDSGASQQKFTISGWFKNCEPDYPSDNAIFANYTDGSNWAKFGFQGDNNQLRFFSKTSGSTDCDIQLSAVSRDVSAWYHFVCAVDTTQGTSSNRIKVYVNGVQQTSFLTSSYPSVNANLYFNNAISHEIGSWNNSQFYDGYMAEFCFINNQQLDATSFGEFDEDSGIWKPIDVSELTFGTNGFYLDFEDSAALGDDVSGNGNDFTVNNLTAIDQSTDTCTNNFATWNPNLAMNSTMVIADGNLTGTTGSNYASGASNCWFSTIGVSSGKWYGEFKESAGTNDQGQILGVGFDLSKHQQGGTASAYNVGYIAEGWGYLGSEGTVVNNNSIVLSGLSTWTVGDTIGIALDMDNHKLYFRKNGGSWENSGNPESGSTGTGAISLTTGETYFFGNSDASLSNTYTFQANFGSPPFAISSGNTDGNGYGNFEFEVPSGYFSLCTKNLAEYG